MGLLSAGSSPQAPSRRSWTIPVDEIELTAVTDSVFVTRVEDETTWTPLVFYALEDGSPYLHAGLRASPRGEDQPG